MAEIFHGAIKLLLLLVAVVPKQQIIFKDRHFKIANSE
jgi:hypothetical protein